MSSQLPTRPGLRRLLRWGRPAAHPDGPSEPTARPGDLVSPPRWRHAAVGGLAALGLVGAFLAGTLVDQAAPTPPPAAQAAPPVADPTARPTAQAAPPVALPTAPPPPTPASDAPPVDAPLPTALEISIPDLGIAQPMVGLGIMADGRLAAPEVFEDIGWWSDGPAPGEPGAAIVVGHVTSKDGPAVFYDLPSLEIGAVVSFQRPDGTTVRFRVTDKQTFPKDDFPDDLVYRLDGKPSVHLVTCGGIFDRRTGHYPDNVVVFADLIEEVPANSSATAPVEDATTPGGHVQ